MNNKIGNYIKNYRGDRSLREFAEKIGISHTHLDSIEKGYDPRTGKQVNVTVDVLKKIAQAMNMTINDLFIKSGEVELSDMDYNIDYLELDRDVVKIPVLGRIPAGIPFEAIEDTYTVDYEEIPSKWLKGGKTFFALKLDGNSMEPDFKDNDVVIFEKKCDCESGDYCCIKVNGFDATFKKVLKQDNGLMLIPLNPNNSTGFKPTFYTKEDINRLPVEIIGVIKRGIRDYNGKEHK